MPDWLRALIAGYSAKKLGGGCFSTILIFVVIYVALGQCNRHVVRHGEIKQQQQTAPALRPAVITDQPGNRSKATSPA